MPSSSGLSRTSAWTRPCCRMSSPPWLCISPSGQSHSHWRYLCAIQAVERQRFDCASPDVILIGRTCFCRKNTRQCPLAVSPDASRRISLCPLFRQLRPSPAHVWRLMLRRRNSAAPDVKRPDSWPANYIDLRNAPRILQSSPVLIGRGAEFFRSVNTVLTSADVLKMENTK